MWLMNHSFVILMLWLPLFRIKAIQNKRHNFIRRTKPTPAPAATTPQTTTDPLQQETIQETTPESPEPTTKYTRHRGFKLPTKKDAKDNVEEKKVENGAKKVESAKNDRPPSLKLKNEPRPFRRRSGANATTTTRPTASSVTIRASRPFRVGSRPQRKPFGTTTTSTTEEPTTLADEEVPTTVTVATSTVISDESLQDIEERESIEDPGLKPRIAPSKKTVKIQRRPLTSLSSLREIDQNPSATNEERKGHPKDTAPGKGQIKETSDKKGQTAETADDGKRHSKKFSASIKQNELNEIIKQMSQEVEDASDVTTMLKDSEAALALVTQQLLAAPLPIVPNYDTPIAKPASSKTHSSKIISSTQQYLVETSTKDYSTHLPIVHSSGLTGVSYSSTPIYKSSSYTSIPREFSASPFSSTTGVPKSSAPFSAKPYLPNRPSGFTIGDIYPMSPSVGPSTARFLGQRDKFGGIPIEDFGYSTDSYVGGLQQEPAYFTREYLLESPVTKSYDDNYQYLSPITTPRPFTTKPARKVIHKKISTTLPPTTPSLLLLPTTAKPLRARKQPITTQKPFAKIKKTKEYRPIENYDYYDDTNEKLAGKYLEGTKVIVHAKGAIECLDIGNFPHPVSCKKFIQCAERSGRIVGWEYICPRGLSFDPVGGMCNWSAGLGCEDQV